MYVFDHICTLQYIIGLIAMTYLFAIETSCDDTSMSILNIKNKRVISYITFNQNKIHRNHGGIIPELAVNEHIHKITEVFMSLLNKSNILIKQIKFIAATKSPGLQGSLRIGLNFSLGLGKLLDIPVIGVNHLQSHLLSNLYEDGFPHNFIGLVISGGHTSLYLRKYRHIFLCIGSTKDDAIGESFDKVGRLLGLKYPSGSTIDRLSNDGNHNRFIFPVPQLDKPYFNFSFSGLKSFSYNLINHLFRQDIVVKQKTLNDMCSSLRTSFIIITLEKAFVACKIYGLQSIVVGGGVASNRALKLFYFTLKKYYNMKICIPKIFGCTDNAAMVGKLGIQTLIS